MTGEYGPDQPGDKAFTAKHATELRALLETEQSRVPSLKEKHLPGYEGAALGLDPIERDEQFQDVMATIEPLRSEEAWLQREYWAHAAERDAGRTGTLTQEQLDASRARQIELHQIIRDTLAQQALPILRQRLPLLARLPMYAESLPEQEKSLDLEPAVQYEQRVQYGPCEVDAQSIVSAPSYDNWAGIGYRKSGRESSDLVLRNALDMLAGDYHPTATELPIVRVAADRSGKYVYLAEDGTHRIGAAKLLGRNSLMARVVSYNYTGHDTWANDVDAEQRARQIAPGDSSS